MNNAQRRKLRVRLMVTVISLLSCIAVMSVGVYAASRTFSAQISNKVNVDIAQVDGELYARRFGNVIYGTESKKDGEDATIDYIKLYDHINGENAANKEEIQKQVNFNTSTASINSEEFIEINYVFKFVIDAGTPYNVKLTLTDSSSTPNAKAKDNVFLTYKYIFSQDEPEDWSVAGDTLTSGTGVVATSSDVAKHCIYILAQLKVSTIEKYSLGVTEEYIWAFNLSLQPVA